MNDAVPIDFGSQSVLRLGGMPGARLLNAEIVAEQTLTATRVCNAHPVFMQSQARRALSVLRISSPRASAAVCLEISRLVRRIAASALDAQVLPAALSSSGASGAEGALLSAAPRAKIIVRGAAA